MLKRPMYFSIAAIALYCLSSGSFAQTKYPKNLFKVTSVCMKDDEIDEDVWLCVRK